MEENGLKAGNIKHCLDTLKKSREKGSMSPFRVGLHLGYLEACLQSYSRLETFTNKEGNSEVIKEVIKSDKWWKKDKQESYEEAIVRMTQKLIAELEK